MREGQLEQPPASMYRPCRTARARFIQAANCGFLLLAGEPLTAPCKSPV